MLADAPVQSALVLGGGIDGLAAAIALAQEHVHVDLRAAPSAGDAAAGAAVDIAGRSVDALDALGILAEVLPAATVHDATLFDPSGSLLPERAGTDEERPAALTVSVAALTAALRDRAEALGVAIADDTDGGHDANDSGVSSVDGSVERDHALVTFQDGSTCEPDLVVAADGIGSPLRALVFGDAVADAADAAIVSDETDAGDPPTLRLDGDWHQGRVVLVGAAAHVATSALPAGGLALEDAVVLGQCVAHADATSGALEAFTRRRRVRVDLVVDASRELQRLARGGAAGMDAAAQEERAAALRGRALGVLAMPY